MKSLKHGRIQAVFKFYRIVVTFTDASVNQFIEIDSQSKSMYGIFQKLWSRLVCCSCWSISSNWYFELHGRFKKERTTWLDFFLLHLWRLRRYSSGERMIAFCLMGERGASSGKRYNLSIGAKCQICTRSTDTIQIDASIIIFSPTAYLQFYRFYFNWSTILFYDFACLCWIKEVNFC